MSKKLLLSVVLVVVLGIPMAHAATSGGDAILSTLATKTSPTLPNIFLDSRSECDLYDVDPEDRCSYIKKECGHYKLGFINYLQLYHCTLHNTLSSFAFMPVAVELGLLFTSIGLTASEYLCPNLYTISKGLHLSDNLAGLTLLALGNGAPDVLTTYTAFNLGSQNLAVSELIGAAFFITTIVIGSMGIIHPFRVNRTSFIRDLSFFIIILVVMLFLLLEKKLTFATCAVLAFLYIIYVVVVISSHSINKANHKRIKRDQRSRDHYVALPSRRLLADAHGEDVAMDELDRLPGIDALTAPSIEITTENGFVVERASQMADDEDGDDEEDEEADTLMGSGRYGVKRLLDKLQHHASHRLQLSLNNYDGMHSAGEFNRNRGYSDNEDEENTEISDNDVVRPFRYTTSAPGYTYGSFPTRKVLFPNFENYAEMNLRDKVYTVALSPVLFLLRVTNPVRDQACFDALRERERHRFDQLDLSVLESQTRRQSGNDDSSDDEEPFDFVLDRTILIIQNFGSNVFITFVWFRKGEVYWSEIFPISMLVSLCIALLAYVLYGRDTSKIRVLFYLSTIIGFVSSMTWISIFATEVIGILKIFSLIYNLSDEILGTTIFALGNSVSDLISNFTIAQMGMPLMAFGACFGGPLLTFSSLGITGLLHLISHYEGDETVSYLDRLIPFNLQYILVLTHLGLVANLIFLIIAVPRNNWYIDKKISYVSIAIWILTTFVSVFIELVHS